MKRSLLVVLPLLLIVSACGGSSDGEEVVAAAVVTAEQSVEASSSATAFEPAGTLTIGEQTWQFTSLICSLSAAEEGEIEVGSTITALNDEFRMSLNSHPRAGDFANLSDFNFDDPAVSYVSDDSSTTITITGRTFTGTGEFLDNTNDSGDRIAGTFSGDCS